ncbi:tetratricopeptide repeat protein [Desulfovibrio sp. JC022]|uniref:tetratricopeptide repeat protein n=1 Tax=Desulfovibrio sp. JC022 TaxID=2593642 RepID=UPI0013D54A8C|nr:tetratricopeptide repeat protein [Desulfovibrio sp. JC022]NDV21479.1 sel1 repeat family protein [Desulfovibrio sp. JC022]
MNIPKVLSRLLFSILSLVFTLCYLCWNVGSHTTVFVFVVFPVLFLFDYFVFVLRLLCDEFSGCKISTYRRELAKKLKTSFHLFFDMDFTVPRNNQFLPNFVVSCVLIILSTVGASQVKYDLVEFYVYDSFYNIMKDYSAKRESLSGIAGEGNIYAQLRLGAMYEKGIGGDIDYVKSAEWYALAEKQRSAKAAFELGVLYLQGLGVPKDCSLSFTLFKKSADKKYAAAMTVLSAYYYLGECSEKDYSQAFDWAERASMNGNLGGRLVLADYYYRGIGVEQDRSKAKELYAELDELNVSVAQVDFARKLLYEDADKNKSEAIRLLERASENGNTRAVEILNAMKDGE